MKIADNLRQKMTAMSDPAPPQSQLPYILINIASLAMVCGLVLHLRREEEEEKARKAAAEEKMLKLNPAPQPPVEAEGHSQKKKHHSHILPPESIGSKLEQPRYELHRPVVTITEEDLQFFKTLRAKEEPAPTTSN